MDEDLELAKKLQAEEDAASAKALAGETKDDSDSSDEAPDLEEPAKVMTPEEKTAAVSQYKPTTCLSYPQALVESRTKTEH